MELFHLVGSNKPSQLYDKKTSLRLLSALHDKITARHGSKTAHRVRIVVKADKLARRERKKPLQDRLPAPDDAPAPERQDKENLDSSLAKSASVGIPATLTIKEEVDVDHLETIDNNNRTSATVSSQEILKEVDRGAGHSLRTEELPVLLVPKKGRELARTPARPQTSTDKKGCDEDGGDAISSPPILMHARASPAHLQSDSANAVTRVQSSWPNPTTSDISNDLSLPSKTLNEISSACQVAEVITQPQSSALSPMPQISCLPTNMANVRKSVAPILSGANVLELLLTPVSTPVSEDRNVIPSGRQIARTPVTAPLGDDPSLEDASLTSAMKDETFDDSVLSGTERIHLIKMNKNQTVEGKSGQDSNETSSDNILNLQPDQRDNDGSSIENHNGNGITADFRSKLSEDVTSPNVTVADPTSRVKNNIVGNTLVGLPLVEKLVTRQESSPRFIPFPVAKGTKRPCVNSTIAYVDSADAKDLPSNNGGAKITPCQPEIASNSMLSSADENDITASPSVCRDPPPLVNDTFEGATEGCSSSVDLGTIILEPPPGFDSSCPSDHGEGEVNSSCDLSEHLASETCIETRRNFPSVSFGEKESPDHLAVQKCNKDKTYNIEATQNYEDKRKTFVVSKSVYDSDSKMRRTTFVVPQNINCVNSSNLNTHECKRRTFVVPPDEIASNTLIVQANESRELMPSPGMSAVSFGELTLLPENVGEHFIVDQSVSNPQECCTGHLALSSTEEELSCYSMKYSQSDCEGSEGSDAYSTPPSNRGDPDNFNNVPRGRQLYRTPVTGLGKNEVSGGTEQAGDGSSQAGENDLDNQATENINELTSEGLLSVSKFSADDEVGIETNVNVSGVESEEKNVSEKSVICVKTAGAIVKVSSVTLEKDLTCSDLDETHETRAKESLFQPVELELCKNETYIKDDSRIVGYDSPQVRKHVLVTDKLISEAALVNNAMKSVVEDMEDSCDLDDSGNIFKPVKNKQVKRNLPVEKRSHGAGNKRVKRPRKDSIEHLLIKQLNAEHLLSPLILGNDQTGHSVRNTKTESYPSISKRGRKKTKVNATMNKNKSKAVSAVSMALVKAEQTDTLIATVVRSISDPEVDVDRPLGGIETTQSTNPAHSSVLNENAGSKEVFDELKAKQNSHKVTEGEEMVTDRKVAHTYSKKTKLNCSLSKLSKNHFLDKMIAEPQKSMNSDDLINEMPEKSMGRPRRQRGTKVVDYNESPFVTPTLPPSRRTRGKPAKHCHGTDGDGASVKSDTHEPSNILGTPRPFSEMLETSTTNRDNLECSDDDFSRIVSANDADEIVPNISGRDSGENDDCVNSKQPTRRGRVRDRGGRKGPSLVMSATKSNAMTSRRGPKHNVLPNTSDARDVPETVSRKASLTKRGVKIKSAASVVCSRAREEHESPALRECSFTSISKRCGKKIASSNKTHEEGIATVLPGECILEVLAPALKNRSGGSRERRRTSAKQGKGKGTQPIASKSGQLKELDCKTGDIVEEIFESEHEKENFRNKESLSTKKVAGGRVPAHTKAVKNKRSAKSVNNVTPQLSLSPGLPNGFQNVNKEHDNTGDILPQKRTPRVKSAIIRGVKKFETSSTTKTKDDGVQKKRTPVISKTKTTTKGKVVKSASIELEREFVETKASAVPKRKGKRTNREEPDDEESPNKKMRVEALNGRPDENLAIVAVGVSSRGANKTKSNHTKALSVKSSQKVTFQSSAVTSVVTGRGSSKSKVGTEVGPAAVMTGKPRTTRARAGRATAT